MQHLERYHHFWTGGRIRKHISLPSWPRKDSNSYTDNPDFTTRKNAPYRLSIMDVRLAKSL